MKLDNDTRRTLEFGAILATSIFILAFGCARITGGPLAEMVFYMIVGFGGAGAIMGFVAGRASRGYVSQT